ncbi:tetratricopeptide repeat protein [Aliivibrio fischeri]|uniref:cellulose synthase subunit BcsC-related outer membrane protein n=1 Tax=Aliivibrio fischeri TaxID=668 RepID=UPI0012D92E3F|nr:cellulose synthase subunit BcsC-related outer membrane protein [Aliivibrio fischeri]MUK29025.1 tetratricopeptide repeat protein [Aliivibrio fischeri]
MSVSKYRLKQFISFAVLGAMYAAPVSAVSLNRDIHNHKPIVFQQDVSKVQSKVWLIKQLTYAQLLHRPDITQTTLKRLFAIDPENVEGLSFQAQYLAKSGQVEQAKVILKTLQQKHPKSKVTRQLNDVLSLYGDNKAAYQQIMLQARSGRNKQALTGLKKLFPNGMPTPEIQLQYLKIESGVEGHERRVLFGLKKLNKEHPGVPDFQLAYAEHISRGNSSNPEAMQLLQRLSLEPSVSNSAGTLWLSRLDDTYITDDVVLQYAILASYFPSNTKYKKAWIDAKKRLDKEKELRKDPRYMAKLDGLKELERGHYLNAQQKLFTALKARPNDPEILGALGMTYLRLGQQEAALSYFQKAKKYDKDLRNTDKWNGLINSSSYWSYLEIGEKKMKRGDFDGASRKYHQAVKFEPDDPYAYNYLAELALVQHSNEEALRYYKIALSKNSLDETALRGWFNVNIALYGEEQALVSGRKLPKKAQKVLAERFHEVEISMLIAELNQAMKRGDTVAANTIVDKLLSDPPSSPWLRSDIADSLYLIGQEQRADKQMQIWSMETPTPEMKFAYALYLARYGNTPEAINQLTAISKESRSDAMISNLNRLEMSQTFGSLYVLAKDDPDAAEREIERLKVKYASNPDAIMSLIDIQYQLGFSDKAIESLGNIHPADRWEMETQLHYGELLFQFEQNSEFEDWQQSIKTESIHGNLTIDQTIRRDLLFAEYAYKNEQYEEAEHYYSLASQLHSQYQHDALLGVIKSREALGKEETVLPLALHLYSEEKALSSRNSVELAGILSKHGHQHEASLLVKGLSNKQDSDAIDYRNGMSVAMTQQDWGLAKDMAKLTLIEDALDPQGGPTVAQDEAQIKNKGNDNPKNMPLRHLYHDADDNWLTRNVKSDLDYIYARDQGYVSFGVDYSAREGANKSVQIPVEAIIPMPEYDGHLQLRADVVHLNSGDIDYYDPTTRMNEKDTGTAFGIGWLADSWSADIGTTPVGFDQQNMVGGLNLSGDLGDIGWKATLSRRSETSSTLSYAGMTVPDIVSNHQGDEWGGVMKTGIKLGGSYDLGGDVGYWASAQFHKMTGKSVEDNTRLGLLGGTYWKIINENDKRLSLGLNLMYLNYDKNLSEYAYGYGGYYSPQDYFSVSIPVNYYERINNGLSYLVSGSISNSWSKEDDPYVEGATLGSSRGGGFGFSLEAAVEQRISKRWYLGAAVDIQRSDFYEPNHLLFYAKYTFTDRWQPIAMPVNPLTLYGDFD